MYKLAFYVPEQYMEKVKNALFEKGAGKIGKYDCCAWQTKGMGQYRPLADSSPHQGQADCLELVDEYLVEMVCEDNLIREVIEELKRVHPYEEVAYAVYPINAF